MTFPIENEIQPVPTPRFVSPRRRVSYDHEEVQDIVLQAFGGLLPRVALTEVGLQYGANDEERKRICESEVAEPGLLKKVVGPKLAAGRKSLLETIERDQLPEGVKALLLNFRLPDPENDIARYRVFQGEHGELCSMVCWAYENPELPFLPIEQVIAKFDPPPPEELRSSDRSHPGPVIPWKLATLGTLAALIIVGVFLSLGNEPEYEIPIISAGVLEDGFPPQLEEEVQEVPVDQPKPEQVIAEVVEDKPAVVPDQPSLDRILTGNSSKPVADSTPESVLNAEAMVLNK